MTDEPIKRSSVSVCLVCAAKMLETADSKIDSKDARVAVLTAYGLQAAMCMKAADVADEMVDVLHEVLSRCFWEEDSDDSLHDRVRDVIRKATAP